MVDRQEWPLPPESCRSIEVAGSEQKGVKDCDEHYDVVKHHAETDNESGGFFIECWRGFLGR